MYIRFLYSAFAYWQFPFRRLFGDYSYAFVTLRESVVILGYFFVAY